MVPSFAGFGGQQRQSLPNKPGEAINVIGGVKLEQGACVDEDVVIETKGKRPADALSYARFFSNMRFSENSDFGIREVHSPSSNLSNLMQQSNNPMAPSVTKYDPLQIASNSEKRVNFSP